MQGACGGMHRLLKCAAVEHGATWPGEEHLSRSSQASAGDESADLITDYNDYDMTTICESIPAVAPSKNEEFSIVPLLSVIIVQSYGPVMKHNAYRMIHHKWMLQNIPLSSSVYP